MTDNFNAEWHRNQLAQCREQIAIWRSRIEVAERQIATELLNAQYIRRQMRKHGHEEDPK